MKGQKALRMKRETLISLEGSSSKSPRTETTTRNGHELGQVGPTQDYIHNQRQHGMVCLGKGQMKGEELKGRARTAKIIHRHSPLANLPSPNSL